MTQPLALAEVEAFLYTVAERYAEPAVLYLIGGIALRFLGHPRTTVDLDYVGPDLPLPTDRFAVVLAEVATDLQIEVEAVPIDTFVPVPPDAEGRHIPVGQYGTLSVYIFDPYTIALTKLDRGFEADLEDVRFLIQGGYVRLDRLEHFVEATLQQAARFHIDPTTFRQHLEVMRQLL